MLGIVLSLSLLTLWTIILYINGEVLACVDFDIDVNFKTFLTD